MKRVFSALAVSAFVAFVWTTAAIAGSGPSLSGYNRPGSIQANVQGAKGVLGTSTGSGSLPFTGVDLGIITVVGLTLLALGWKLRRAGRQTA